MKNLDVQETPFSHSDDVLIQSSLLFAFCGLDGRFRTVSRGFARLFESHQDGMAGLPFTMFLKDDLGLLNTFLQQVRRGEPQVYRGNVRSSTMSDRELMLSVEASVVGFENGDPKIFFVMTDISARTQIEDLLRINERRLRSIQETDAVGVYYFNFDGSIFEPNETLLRMAGYSREEAEEGIDWREHTPEDWREQDSLMLEKLSETGGTVTFMKEIGLGGGGAAATEHGKGREMEQTKEED